MSSTAATAQTPGRQFNLVRWIVWGGAALLMAVLPQLFTQGFAITLMSQMGVMIIFALSYNMLLGQSGMLSFGHAVYSGLGAYVAIHALNLAANGTLWMPVSLLPLVGGLEPFDDVHHHREEHDEGCDENLRFQAKAEPNND